MPHDRYTAGNVGLQSTLFERLTLTGGMREESATYGGDAFTWRLGGVLALPELWSRAEASLWHRASWRPRCSSCSASTATAIVGNPNLQPERSQGGEVGWAVDLPALGRRDGATIEVTYFANHIRDLIQIVYAPDHSSSTPQNVASAPAPAGVESQPHAAAGGAGPRRC